MLVFYVIIYFWLVPNHNIMFLYSDGEINIFSLINFDLFQYTLSFYNITQVLL